MGTLGVNISSYGRGKFFWGGGENWTVQYNLRCMWHWRGNVAYLRLSDWTRLQWPLCSYSSRLTKRVRAFSAMSGGDAALPNHFGRTCLLYGDETYCYPVCYMFSLFM